MKRATRSKDGEFRLTIRCEHRVYLEMAAEAIADQFSTESVEVDQVGRMGAGRLISALRDALAREGKGRLYYVSEKHDYDDEWEGLVAAVRARLLALDIYPPT